MAEIKNVRDDSSQEEFEIGDQVQHPKWGEGTILYKSGSGDRAKVIVIFSEEGQKKLLVKHARLKKIRETQEEQQEDGQDQ
jgi:DNA helicase-2/ATP-dependent DNA helicase PcrA